MSFKIITSNSANGYKFCVCKMSTSYMEYGILDCVNTLYAINMNMEKDYRIMKFSMLRHVHSHESLVNINSIEMYHTHTHVWLRSRVVCVFFFCSYISISLEAAYMKTGCKLVKNCVRLCFSFEIHVASQKLL